VSTGCLRLQGSSRYDPRLLNLHACFLSPGAQNLAGLDAYTKQYLGTPSLVAAMLNATPLTPAASRRQRPGASTAATFLRATLPALPFMGLPAQLASPGCFFHPLTRGAGLGDGDGDGDGEAFGGDGDDPGLGDGLGDARAGGEGLGTAGFGDGTGLETGVDDAARREVGSALRGD
jgi:hypothetical protein